MFPAYLGKGGFPTGSNYICNPPVTNTDIDTMYYVYNMPLASEWLEQHGWIRSGVNEYATDAWRSYRKGNLNALITNDITHYAKFYHATELAKSMNLLDKEDRIALFNMIMGE